MLDIDQTTATPGVPRVSANRHLRRRTAWFTAGLSRTSTGR